MPVGLKRTFLQVLVASLLATAALAIGFLLLADFNERTWKVIGTTALLSGFSLLGLPGAALLDQGRSLALGWANLVLAAVGLIYALVLVWGETDTGWKLFVAIVAFTGAAAQASGTTSRTRDDDRSAVVFLYLAGLGGAVLLASLISIAAWQEVESGGYYRALGALAVAVVVTTILQPILRRTAAPAPAAAPAEFRCVLDDGRTFDCTDAVAGVVARLERDGAKVVRIERSSA